MNENSIMQHNILCKMHHSGWIVRIGWIPKPKLLDFMFKKTKYNTDVVTSNIAACLAFSWRAPLLLSTSSSTWWSTHFFLCYCKHACATKFKTLISCSFFFPITTSQNLHHYQFSKFNKFSFFMSCIIMCHVSGCKAWV